MLMYSSVLSVKGNKVLHIDRNDHYGGEAASINIETVCMGNLHWEITV